MNPGAFKHRITFRTPPDPDQQNENGFPETEWSNVKSVWCEVRTMKDKGSSMEFYEAATTHAKNTLTFVIRYTKGLDTDMVILFKGATYEILSIINDGELNKSLTIVGREVS